jgi:hypothetical protein
MPFSLQTGLAHIPTCSATFTASVPSTPNNHKSNTWLSSGGSLASGSPWMVAAINLPSGDQLTSGTQTQSLNVCSGAKSINGVTLPLNTVLSVISEITPIWSGRA